MVFPLERDFTELYRTAARLRVASFMVATTTACGSCTRFKIVGGKGTLYNRQKEK
jgi:hypothetical protein